MKKVHFSFAEVFPAITGVCYVGASVVYFLQGERWTAWAYFCYALANIGLIGMGMNARGR